MSGSNQYHQTCGATVQVTPRLSSEDTIRLPPLRDKEALFASASRLRQLLGYRLPDKPSPAAIRQTTRLNRLAFCV